MVPVNNFKGSAASPDREVGGPIGSNKLGKNEFLKLMMAQLGNQDPTAPSDSQAFVAQLAAFATLELQQNANTNMESLLLAQASANQTAMTNFVGKEVVFKTDSVELNDGDPAITEAALSKPAKNVTAVVVDDQGKTVRTMQLGPHDAGAVTVEWDGRDDNGTRLPAGSYKMRVTAQDKEGETIAVEQRGSGHVTGIAYEDGVAMVKIGGTKIKVSEIIEVNERNTK